MSISHLSADQCIHRDSQDQRDKQAKPASDGEFPHGVVA